MSIGRVGGWGWFLGVGGCVWFIDATMAMCFWFEEPASEVFRRDGAIDWGVIAFRIGQSMAMSAVACSVLLSGRLRPAAAVFGLGVLAGAALIGLGLITNSMGEYYDSGGPNWNYIGVTFSSGFLAAAGVASASFWVSEVARRIIFAGRE